MAELDEEYGAFDQAALRQWRVLFALMLRNMRSRFFGNGLGYLIAIGWPTVHILLLVAIFSGSGRAPPIGESMVQFIVTGSIAFWTFSYLSRFMMFSVIMTRPLFGFPEVKVLDVMLSAAIQEILSSCCVVLIFIGLAWLFDVEWMPHDVVGAFSALGGAILLGVGFGLLNGVMALGMPFWPTIYALLTIALWGTSGVLFVPDALPEPIRTWAAYHPILQSVEWMRSAYYPGFGDEILDRAYVIKWGVGSVFLGLVIERGIRGHLLALK
jgi:capsular polysaccharide transport system permease protein